MRINTKITVLGLMTVSMRTKSRKGAMRYVLSLRPLSGVNAVRGSIASALGLFTPL